MRWSNRGRQRGPPSWLTHPEVPTHSAKPQGMGGSVTLQPLAPAQARAHWQALLQAWQEGLHRPLPLALQSALAWLDKGGSASDADNPVAFEAARATFEDHDPRFGRRAEREGNDYLARAFPNFHALWSEGGFAHWAAALLQPLCDAVGKPPREQGP